MILLKYVRFIIVLSLITSVATIPPNSSLSYRAYATTHNISLVGHVSGWNDTRPGPTISALFGDTINIQFSQPDTQHRFYVDVNRNQVADCSTFPFPDICGPFYLTPTSFSFPANVTGSFTYYCSLHPFMTGTFNVLAPDFALTPNPTSLTLTRGSSQTSVITVSSVNGFSGTVNLSLPNTPTEISAEFLSGQTLTVSPSASGTASLNITAGVTASTGSYTVPILGSNGTISQTTNLTVSVVTPDFGVTSSPTSLSIFVGSSGIATITLTSQNGFTGSLNLMVSASPSTVALSLSPLAVSLSSGGSATSTLNVSTTFGSTTSSPGTYTVTVTATATGSPSISHTTTLSVEAKSATSGNTPTSVLIVAGLTVGAAGGIAGYAILRRRGRKQGSVKPR